MSHIAPPPDCPDVDDTKKQPFRKKRLARFNIPLRGTVKSKAPLRVQFSPALGEGGGGKGLKPKLLLGFTK